MLMMLQNAAPIVIVLRRYVFCYCYASIQCTIQLRFSHSHLCLLLLPRQYQTPTLECEQFVRDNQCEQNDDMLPRVTARTGGCTEDGVIIGFAEALYRWPSEYVQRRLYNVCHLRHITDSVPFSLSSLTNAIAIHEPDISALNASYAKSHFKAIPHSDN